MEQFVRYLYEYRNGQPSRNVGFVKVEQGEEQTTVHIHGKGLQLGKESELQLYIFYVDQETPVGILQGTIVNINPAVNYRLVFTGEDTGRPENYSRVQGIIMESAKKRKFAAVWSDMPVPVDDMRIWRETEVVPLSVTETIRETVAADIAEEKPEPEPEIIPQEREEPDTYITPSKIQYKKIRRQDIAMLPRCEWRLANNSFLLHGYYNYHHLILIEEGEETWLGVPGIYHSREAKAAEAFGFVRFVRVDDGEMELNADERETTGDFGYWCRKVRQMNHYRRPY